LAMAAVRLVTPSRVKMFSRCFRTVLTETTSWRGDLGVAVPGGGPPPHLAFRITRPPRRSVRPFTLTRHASRHQAGRAECGNAGQRATELTIGARAPETFPALSGGYARRLTRLRCQARIHV
jgi:hypothetical protein